MSVLFTLPDGLILNAGGDGVVDEHGTRWNVDEESGWFSGPTQRAEPVARPQDGDQDNPAGRGPRRPILAGFAAAPDRATAMLNARRIAGMLAQTVYGELSGTNEHGTLTTTVRLDDEPTVEWLSDTVIRWRLVFYAPDPRLYGPEHVASMTLPGRGDAPGLLEPLTEPLTDGWNPTLSGELVLPNPGKAVFWPRLRIVGPAPNPRIWSPDTGAELRFRLTVPAGQFVDVLCKDRRVLAQGVASRRAVVSYTGDWLAIPPGGASLRWAADLYDPDARLFAWSPEGAWL